MGASKSLQRELKRKLNYLTDKLNPPKPTAEAEEAAEKEGEG